MNQFHFRNRLLTSLPRPDFARLAEHLEFVDLPRLFPFSEPNEATTYSYFLESGIGSIVVPSSAGGGVEVGLFGREGMTPTAAALDARADPFFIFMQISGEGHRIRNSVFMPLIAESPALKTTLARYAQAQSIQSAYTARSNAIHQVHERLARWILMCHDRTEGNEIALTHEFLSDQLAVRRQSVTTGLHILEGQSLISSQRGRVVIRDRPGLEAFARDAYGIPEQEYDRLLGYRNRA